MGQPEYLEMYEPNDSTMDLIVDRTPYYSEYPEGNTEKRYPGLPGKNPRQSKFVRAHEVPRQPRRSRFIPYNGSPKQQSKIRAAGESGRRGFHPLKFLYICYLSSCAPSKWVNTLFPVVPFAFVMHYVKKELTLVNFIVPYVAMLPAANLLGFASQELASKLPRVLGVLLASTFGSLVELIMLFVLLLRGDAYITVIKAAILGSILANLLVVTGMAFVAGGVRREEQYFHEAVSEVGNGLLLVAGSE